MLGLLGIDGLCCHDGCGEVLDGDGSRARGHHAAGHQSADCWADVPIYPWEPAASARERPPSRFRVGVLEELHGPPLRASELFVLAPGCPEVQQAEVRLHANGLSVGPCSSSSSSKSQPPELRALSPFSHVAQRQLKTQLARPLSHLFQLTEFRRDGDRVWVFAPMEDSNSDQECDAWICEMNAVIAEVNASLFRAADASVWPVRGVPATSMRVMAGSLLSSEGDDGIALYYCELQAHRQGAGSIALYSNAWCEQELCSLPITQHTSIGSQGNSTIFGVGGRLFSARSAAERDVWVRAASNIQVKLCSGAPDPSHEELYHYRQAVQERLQATGGSPERPGGAAPAAPLLPAAAEGMPRSAALGAEERQNGWRSRWHRRKAADSELGELEDPFAVDAKTDQPPE